MTDILSDLRAVANVNGDTYSSAEVLAMVRRAADEIERLRAALKPFAELGYSGVPTQRDVDHARKLLDEQI